MRALFTRTAGKQMDALDPSAKKRVVQEIEEYLLDPARPGAARPLVGRMGYFRLRAGDWRVIFFLEEEFDLGKVMVIEQVGHRRDVYER